MSTSSGSPRDKADLLSQLDAAGADLRATIAAIPADDLATTRDASVWSVADHLAHVAAWERWKIALLRGESCAGSLGVDQETYESDDTDAINAAIQAATTGQTTAAAIAASERTHAELVGLISTCSDEELGRPYSDIFPDQPDIDGDPTLLDLCAYTIEHIAEHTGLLRAMAPARRTPRVGQAWRRR